MLTPALVARIGLGFMSREKGICTKLFQCLGAVVSVAVFVLFTSRQR